MSELNAFDITVAEEGYCEGSVKYRRAVYDKSEADNVIAEKDKEIRRLQRALWLARAERAKEMCQRLLIQGFDPKWENVERKCLKKSEEYK